MPEARATARYLRISPSKVRQVLDDVRGKDVHAARALLRFHPRSASEPVMKVLNSAVANAEHNFHLDEDELYVATCFADEGVTLKRWRPRARGRATRIRKRTSHVTIVLDRLTPDELARRQTQEAGKQSSRAARVAGSRKKAEVEVPATVEAEDLAPEEAAESAEVAESAETEESAEVAESAETEESAEVAEAEVPAEAEAPVEPTEPEAPAEPAEAEESAEKAAEDEETTAGEPTSDDTTETADEEDK
jgi:large subunit ribosomal protein L22